MFELHFHGQPAVSAARAGCPARVRVFHAGTPRRTKNGLCWRMPPTMTKRMRAHDVNHSVSAEFSKGGSADHRIIVATPHIIWTLASKLNQIVDVRLTVRHQVHAADNATRENPPLALPLAICSNDWQHAILIDRRLEGRFQCCSEVRIARFVGQQSSQFRCQLIVSDGHGVDSD